MSFKSCIFCLISSGQLEWKLIVQRPSTQIKAKVMKKLADFFSKRYWGNTTRGLLHSQHVIVILTFWLTIRPFDSWSLCSEVGCRDGLSFSVVAHHRQWLKFWDAWSNCRIWKKIVLKTLDCRMCLDEDMLFKNSSVPTMHASAIGVHSSNLSRTTPPTKVVEDSPQESGRSLWVLPDVLFEWEVRRSVKQRH